MNLPRREFLKKAGVASAPFAVPALLSDTGTLEAGEGRVDITPPPGVLLSGFHYRPGRERRVVESRRPTYARALVLRFKGQMAAILSVDLCAVSREMSARVAKQIAATTGIPTSHVRLCATHTHSAPTGRFARQWGGLPKDHLADVEVKSVEAVIQAVNDLSPCDLWLGKTRAEGAHFNRTTQDWKPDDQFNDQASDDDRWLDSQLRLLRFDRGASKASLHWYHFSAHPVCYTGRKSGPDWPGVVTELCEDRFGFHPSFLQGHCGDVNPGAGARWLGDPDDTAAKVVAALGRCLNRAKRIEVDRFKVTQRSVALPLDIDLHLQQTQRYQRDPESCSSGEYVDAGFAREWYQSMSLWDLKRTHLAVSISSLQLGPIVLLFHPSELFSYYGLRIQRDSPYKESILMGYTDGFIGYLTDPRSHKEREYAAALVPKVLGLPPFRPEAARALTRDALDLLKRNRL